MFLGLPAPGARMFDPVGAHQQAVPPSGPREPYRLLPSPQRNGAWWEQTMGSPTEKSGCHPPQIKGSSIRLTGYNVYWVGVQSWLNICDQILFFFTLLKLKSQSHLTSNVLSIGMRKYGVINVNLCVQHFISQREEFETARDSILVWLTEMDLQLTNIEHFSECDVQAKIKQLRVRTSILYHLSTSINSV